MQLSYFIIGLAFFFGAIFFVIAPFLVFSNRKNIQALVKELELLRNRVNTLEAHIADGALPEVREDQVESLATEVAEDETESPWHLAETSAEPPAPTAGPPAPLQKDHAQLEIEPPRQEAQPAAAVKYEELSWDNATKSSSRFAFRNSWRQVKSKIVDDVLGSSDWEAMIGGSWLNKIGVVVLVVGVVLFLAYSLQYMGPLGKVLVGLATGGVLVGGGIALERLRRYTLFAQPLIGGGWALLYFTAYAAHSIDATRIIDNHATGLILLAAVAAGMIFHSIKYRSEIVTGLAYALAFLALAINPFSMVSFAALAVLAASLVIIFRYISWYLLGPFGVVATYAIHLLWLNSPLPGFPETGPVSLFWASQSMLVLYWVLFKSFAFVRKPESEQEARLGLALSVANTAGFFILSLLQVLSEYPDGVHIFTASTAVAYVGSSLLLRAADRHRHHLLDGTIGALLLAVAIKLGLEPLSISDDWLAPLWLIEGIAVLALGVRYQERVFRGGAYLLSVGIFAALLFNNLLGVPGGWWELPPPRLTDTDPAAHLLLWSIALSVIVYFYSLFEWLPRLSNRIKLHPYEVSIVSVNSGYLATVLLAMLLWKETGPQGIGAVWLGLGLVLFDSGRRYRRLHLRIQGYAVLAAATIALVANNLLGEFGEFRWFIVTPGVAIFYYLYWRLIQPLADNSWHATEQNLVELPGYLASALLALLIWKQTPSPWLGLPWLVVGLILFETGGKFVRLHLRIHGYLVATGALVAILGINLYGIMGATVLDPPSRWIVVPPVIVGFYALYWRLNSRQPERLWHPLENKYAEISCYAATILFTILLWKELSSVAVALAWGMLGLILFEVGSKLNWKALRLQGHILMAMTFARLFMANFAALTDVGGISHRLVTVVPIVAMFYHLRYWAAQNLKPGHATRFEFGLTHAYSFGAAILLVVLARFELGRTHAVIAWSLLWFVLLVLGVRFNDRSFRIQAYLIAILTFVRSWTTNFYLLGSFFGISERIATTVPVILALLLATYVSRAARPGHKARKPKTILARLLQLFDKNGRMLFPILATLLATILLFYQVEGNLLTISWTVEALALMVLGFLTLERSFRLLGLGLFAICLIKLVFIDLAGVETIFRILSFILLGLILLVVSFAYTHYRDTVKRFV